MRHGRREVEWSPGSSGSRGTRIRGALQMLDWHLRASHAHPHWRIMEDVYPFASGGLVASLGSGVSCDRGSVHMKKKMTKSSVSDRLLLVRCSVAREKSHYPQVATVGGKNTPWLCRDAGGKTENGQEAGLTACFLIIY